MQCFQTLAFNVQKVKHNNKSDEDKKYSIKYGDCTKPGGLQ